MDNRFKYQRIFLIFVQEDSGFREGGDPLGYVKIEVKEGKGKLSCQVSNLKGDQTNYKLYLMKADQSELVPVCAGAIPLNRRKGELNWEFDPYDVAKTGLTVEDFNVAAVLVENDDDHVANILCPLAAYKGDRIEWRPKIRKFLNSQRSVKDEINQKTNDEDKGKGDDIISKYDNTIESKYIKESSEEDKKSTSEEMNTEDIENTDKIEQDKKQEEDIKSGEKNNDIDNEDKRTQVKEEEGRLQEIEQKENQHKRSPEEEESQQKEMGVEGDENKEEELNQEANVSEDETGNEGLNSANYRNHIGCVNCFLSNNDVNSAVNNKPGFEELITKFDKYFEKCNPFKAGRKDYKWWKVASPVHLNNILYQMSIKVPILFNPLVLMAHFKYRHLVVGIYEDKGRDMQYVVCGVPGVYWVDEKPFGNLCRWAQVEGNVPRYGAFGYWLVYINPKTGKILSVS